MYRRIHSIASSAIPIASGTGHCIVQLRSSIRCPCYVSSCVPLASIRYVCAKLWTKTGLLLWSKGASNERVQRSCDLGFLMNPGDGAVTALDFHLPAGGEGPSHLMNGSSDGTLSVWQVCCRHSRAASGSFAFYFCMTRQAQLALPVGLKSIIGHAWRAVLVL